MFRLAILAGVVLAIIPTTRPILFRTLTTVSWALALPLLVIWGSSGRRR
jgi:hypothetical protein